MSTQHKNLSTSKIHIPYNWSYADETEREAADGFVSADVGKLALQSDDNSLWILTAVTPTWSQVGGGGKFIQRVYTELLTSASNSTTIPIDDTIPQNTEGTEILTRAITPTGSGNDLYIDINIVGAPASNAWVIAALFKDSDADALKAAWIYQGTADGGISLHLRHKMTAGTTSAITFKVRVGASSGNFRHNGNGSSRLLGGVASCNITVEEVEP